MPIPILSNALLILSKKIVIQKLNITTEEYISSLGFTDVSKHVFQDDYLILDGQFVVHRDHHSEIKDRIEEVKKIPFTQFIHYWKENSF